MRPPESNLSVTVVREDANTVLVLAGELDVYTAARFRERAVDLLWRVHRLLLFDA